MLTDEYRSKLVNANEAVKCVQSGDFVELGFFVNFPQLLNKALAGRKEEVHDVVIRSGPLLFPCEAIESDSTGEHFRIESWQFGGYERKYAKTNRASYMPIRYGESPSHIQNICDTDVLMLETTPMDKHGNFNFGVSIHHFKEAAKKARQVIVEVNEAMPRAHGGYNHYIHISEVDFIVEAGRRPIPIIPSVEATDIEQRIAQHVMSEIQNGACLQLGLGGMPNALGKMLVDSDLKDLGMHSEMFPEAALDLYEAGKLTGSKKALDPGRVAWTFAGGSQRLYDFLDDNPMLAGYPVNYTNIPLFSHQNDNLISINACIEVDLTGQVASESMGANHYSGNGGQLEFVEAAYMSKGGKSFLCMPSSIEKNGELISRIKPQFAAGTAVTVPRTSTHFIVTEYGKANLKGLSFWKRAESLINIAHPKLRDDLIKEAETLGIWRKSNKR
ncbi:MAG: acetyl-CoA hydrolase/transferase C-terminal domain-containing protein [Peptostreptococcales bacterium]|jgi:butyryl-CoA:acetate CoA-transferase